MANEFYDHTTYPATNSSLSSAALRAELDLVEAGFDKLPTLSGNANKVVVVNGSGAALSAVHIFPTSTAMLKGDGAGGVAAASAGTDYVSDIGLSTFAATGKTTPVDGDSIPISDSAASNALKKLTWANLKTTLSATLTSLTGLSGNITFTGTGNRITGDFSNATVANRVMFQTSTVNGNSLVEVVPNGTGTTGSFRANNTADPTNGAVAILTSNATEMALQASRYGTGTYLPMTFYTGGYERLRITTNGDTKVYYTNSSTVSTTSSFSYSVGTHGQVCLITLTNAITVTFAAPANITEGAMYKFILKAGDTSARTFAWNSAFKWPAATVKLSSGTTTNGAFDVITFIGGSGNTLIYDGHSADVR